MVLKIQRNERGLIHVIALNRAVVEVADAVKTQGKAAMVAELLGQTLPETGFELFPIADLAGVGLTGYLADGYAVEPEQLHSARVRLDRLDGYVLLVFSAAFEGRETTLITGPDLTLIGTYGEAMPDMTPRVLESDAAQAYSGTPRPSPAPPPQRRATGARVVAVLIGIAALALWWTLR